MLPHAHHVTTLATGEVGHESERLGLRPDSVMVRLTRLTSSTSSLPLDDMPRRWSCGGRLREREGRGGGAVRHVGERRGRAFGDAV